jgi:hypothetical protein
MPVCSDLLTDERRYHHYRERRLRDIHPGTQQGQGRPIHFETVGQILLGLPPEGRMFR